MNLLGVYVMIFFLICSNEKFLPHILIIYKLELDFTRSRKIHKTISK